MDRLAYLHSVGSNFASLIYELPNDADFDKFDEKCKTILSHLGTNPKLADGLVSIKSFITNINIYPKCRVHVVNILIGLRS